MEDKHSSLLGFPFQLTTLVMLFTANSQSWNTLFFIWSTSFSWGWDTKGQSLFSDNDYSRLRVFLYAWPIKPVSRNDRCIRQCWLVFVISSLRIFIVGRSVCRRLKPFSNKVWPVPVTSIVKPDDGFIFFFLLSQWLSDTPSCNSFSWQESPSLCVRGGNLI